MITCNLKKVNRLSKQYSIILPLFFFACIGCRHIPVQKVCIKNSCIKAEVVKSSEDCQRGLMYRKSLAIGRGMLFAYDREAIRSFWMKNMRFPLDIIWIGADKKIGGISENVPPCKAKCPPVSVKEKSKYVLEVNAGFAQNNHIKSEDEVSMK